MIPHDPHNPGPPGGYGTPGQDLAPRRRSRKPAIIAISAVAVLAVLAVAGVGGYLLLNRGTGSTPGQVAQQTATAMSNGDVSVLRGLACDASTVDREDIVPSGGVGFRVTVTGEPEINGSKAEVPVNLEIDFSRSSEAGEAGLPPRKTIEGSLKLTEREDGWCTDLTKPIGPGQPN